MSDADTTHRLGDEVAGKPDGRQVGQGAGAPRADDDKRPDVEAGAGDPGSGSAAESGEPGSGQGEPGSDRGEPETEGASPAVEPEAGDESQIDARPEGDDDDLIVRVVPPTSRGKDESEKLDQFLLRRYHLHGDRRARDQLITMYLPLVRSLARRYSSRGEHFDDLVQVGSIGLIKAIDRFDLTRGVELTTYATPNIIGEIKRYFRDKGWSVRVPRGLQELNIRLNKVIDELVPKLQRSPTINEIAEAAGATPEEVLEALETSQAYNSVSLQAAPNGESGDDETGLIDYMGTEEAAYDTMEDRTMLAPGFAKLDARERYILHLRFFEGLTQSQIAARVGISQMHVSRLIRRALEKLRANIGEGAL
jgi:RNA polymerase sigma-B factor